MMESAKKLKKYRNSKSIKEFARMIGTHHNIYEQWESGLVEPSERVLSDIRRLVDAPLN